MQWREHSLITSNSTETSLLIRLTNKQQRYHYINKTEHTIIYAPLYYQSAIVFKKIWSSAQVISAEIKQTLRKFLDTKYFHMKSKLYYLHLIFLLRLTIIQTNYMLITLVIYISIIKRVGLHRTVLTDTAAVGPHTLSYYNYHIKLYIKPLY